MPYCSKKSRLEKQTPEKLPSVTYSMQKAFFEFGLKKFGVAEAYLDKPIKVIS
tara:strand:+ start:63 stop:221 length:159 start_codon:yes stop_codon:yes gene_type:complete